VLPELSLEARVSRATAGPFARDDDNRPINARTEYRVDTNDSLYRIAMKLYGTPRMVNALYDANRDAIGPNPERLRFGMILKLPRPAEQTAGK
jgi:nucleoid-associated protein YgaU